MLLHMRPHIITATGRKIELPMFDPVVSAHVNNPNSCTGTLFNEINEQQLYAPLFQNKKDLTFLDIGANIGLVSLYAVDSCSRIVAVEPARETFDVLKAVTLKFPNIEPVNAALAPKDEDCEFFENDINSTASSTVNTYGALTSVAGLKLTSILRIYQLEHVDVAKIDAEGAEGGSLTFDELEAVSPIIKSLYIETHNCPKTTWETKLAALARDLMLLGYRDMKIKGMTIWASQ